MRRVLATAACAAADSAAAPAAVHAASVTTMVAGEERVLRDAGEVRLSERRVKVGRRRCTVGRGTPLGVLAGLGLTLRVRDYGSCGRRARDGSSLFVTRVGPDRNRSRDGRLGAASAATGPDGVATVMVAGSGRLALTASADGMVPAFPGEVQAG